MDGLEIMGSSPGELAAEAPDHSRGELSQYENFFDKEQGKQYADLM